MLLVCRFGKSLFPFDTTKLYRLFGMAKFFPIYLTLVMYLLLINDKF